MTRLVVVLVVVALVVVIARRMERGRRGDPPTRDTYAVPRQLDRGDFPRPDAPWLMVLFSARTCEGCAVMAERVATFESDAVATCEAEAARRRDLHRRYGVEGVPMVVVADRAGVVHAGFVGAISPSDLRAAVPGQG